MSRTTRIWAWWWRRSALETFMRQASRRMDLMSRRMRGLR